MSEDWHYTRGGQQNGPVATEMVRELFRTGSLLPQDMVWRPGMANWLPAASVPELTGLAPQASSGTVDYYRPAYHPTYAGFWIRFAAYFLDYIITYVGGSIVGFILGFMIGMVGGQTEAMEVAAGLVALLGSLVTTWLYFALMESSSRQATLGKMACGLIVTDIEGRRISFGRATGRFFGKFISGLILAIGFIMAAFTERKQALHDMMANTLVLKRPSA